MCTATLCVTPATSSMDGRGHRTQRSSMVGQGSWIFRKIHPSDLSTYFGPLFSTFHCAGHLQAPPVPAIPTGITAPRRVPSTALESLLYATLVPLLSLRLGSRRGAVIPYRDPSTVRPARACAQTPARRRCAAAQRSLHHETRWMEHKRRSQIADSTRAISSSNKTDRSPNYIPLQFQHSHHDF